MDVITTPSVHLRHFRFVSLKQCISKIYHLILFHTTIPRQTVSYDNSETYCFIRQLQDILFHTTFPRHTVSYDNSETYCFIRQFRDILFHTTIPRHTVSYDNSEKFGASDLQSLMCTSQKQKEISRENRKKDTIGNQNAVFLTFIFCYKSLHIDFLHCLTALWVLSVD